MTTETALNLTGIALGAVLFWAFIVWPIWEAARHRDYSGLGLPLFAICAVAPFVLSAMGVQ